MSFDHSFLKKIAFYRRIGKKFAKALPLVYGTYQNSLKNIYMIEMKEVFPVEMLGKEAAYCVLDRILPFHISFHGKQDSLASLKLNCYTARDDKKSRFLMRGLFEGLRTENRIFDFFVEHGK